VAFPFPLRRSHALVLLALNPLSLAALAANPVDLGTVGAASGAGKNVDVFADEGSAAAVAPSQSNLKVGEPQSIVSRAFIEDSVAPTASYFDIMAITPSVVTQPSPNGPGFSDGAKATLRGFADGQYNITFDGIPFGDTNDPTHHSISYFPAQIVGGVVVERGPGNASNLGQATYGGTVQLLSKTPMAAQNTEVYGSLGTWNSRLGGVSYDSGRMAEHGDASIQLNYQHMQSDGYQSYSALNNSDYVFKLQKPVNDSTLLTAFATLNDLKENLPDSVSGPTLQQVAAYGNNYQLNNDPKSQGYFAYNTVHKQADMEYLRLQTDWGKGFESDNNLYTYAYNNGTLAGCDSSLLYGAVADATQVSNCKTKGHVPAGDIVGYDKLNQYRVFGDIFKATQQTAYGLARFGVWLEHAGTSRHNVGWDASTRTDVPFTATTAGSGFVQESSWNQYQPFVEFEWAAADGLTVTPGFKYMHFVREINSAQNQGSKFNGNTQAQSFSNTFEARLPFLTVTQLLGEHDSVYGQLAQGMVVPSLGSMQNPFIAHNAQVPTKTTNYQLGYVHKDTGLTADADLYWIQVNNSETLNPALQVFQDSGNLTYKGIEGELTYVLGAGVSAYVNGAINTALYNAGNTTGYGQVMNAPKGTAGLGLQYRGGGWKGSLIAKYIAEQYAAPDQAYRIGGYSTVDGAASYTWIMPVSFLKSVSTQLSVFNLLDRQSVTAYPSTGAGTMPVAGDPNTQVNYMAPRSFMATVKADF